MDTAEKIKLLRIAHRFIQLHVAQGLCMSLSAYNRAENGKKPFTVDQLKRAAILFRVNLEELLSDQPMSCKVGVDEVENTAPIQVGQELRLISIEQCLKKQRKSIKRLVKAMKSVLGNDLA